MRKLQLDLVELHAVLEDSFTEHRSFLDLESGAVVLVTDETSRELEDVYAELPEEVASVQLVEAIRQRPLQDWQIEELLQADQVERGYGTRYIRVEPRDPHADYREIEEFTPALHQTQCSASVATIKDAHLRDRLGHAISGCGAFRYFKDVLEDYLHERERWFAFKDAQVRQRILDWLAEENIEPITI